MMHTTRGQKAYCLISIICLVIFFVSVLLPYQGAAEQKQIMFYASDGKGTISFYWQPSLAFFPDLGWQLVDTTSNKIVANWKAENRPSAIRQANPGKAESTLALIESIETLSNDKEKEMALGLITLGSMVNFELAKALGFGCSIKALERRHSYRLDILDANQKKIATLWESEPIDSQQQSPLPSAPLEVKATSVDHGVSLFWKVPEEKGVPIISYKVERQEEDSTWNNLIPHPLLITKKAAEDKPRYTDTAAPLEEKLNYRISSVNIFGQASLPTKISLFHADQEALKPPQNLAATGEKEKVILLWSKSQNSFTSGYILERGRSNSGSFTPLTTKGLSIETTKYKDTDVIGGITYFYRIRSIGPRGDLGPPTSAVLVTPTTSGLPAAPKKLQVSEISPIKITLEWLESKKPVAGYIIEKRYPLDKDWRRLNSALAITPKYSDSFHFGTYGTCYYRVIAVAYDSKQSKPSNEVEVKLPGHPQVPRPHLIDVSSKDGIVNLSFKIIGNPELTDKILVVRGNTMDDLGLVIGSPLKAKVTSFTDEMVRPGEDYWYGLIAIDKEGHKSDISDKLLVRVAPKEIPQPDKPGCDYESEPFSHVKISFEKPPGFLLTAILRKTAAQKTWTTIADNVSGTDEIVDADPPRSGSVSYAILYKTEYGATGLISDSKTIDLQ